MTTPETTQAMILGLTLKDVVTAVLIPIVAVITTLIVQERQQTRERRTQVLRHLMASRHMPADGGFNAAINLIPVEFNRARKVMAAWSDYIKQVRFEPSPENEANHHQQTLIRQTKLIAAIMDKLRMAYSEADIQADAYISKGFVLRDNLYLDSLQASRDAATAMAEVARSMQAQYRLLAQQTGAEPPSTGGGES